MTTTILQAKSLFSKIFILFILFAPKANAQNCSVNSGVGYSVCPGSAFILDGNASGLFQGSSVEWSIVSQPGGATVSIVNTVQLSTSTTVATVAGNYVFKLQITCTDLSVVSQTVTYTVNNGATTPGAINNTAAPNPYCVALNGTSTITFTGNSALPGGHSQRWTYSSNVFSGSFSSDAADNPVFTIAAIDKYKCPTTGSITFTRNFTNTTTGCRASVTKTISVITADIPVDAFASLCGGIGLTGTCPGTGTSAWSVVSTTPVTPVTFSNAGGTTTAITNPVPGTQYTIRYTVAGNGCTNGTKDVTFTYNPAPPGSATSPNAGPDQTYALGLPASITLNGNEPGPGETGIWTQVAGPGAVIALPGSAVTSVSGLINGSVYTFRWTITNTVSGCPAHDDVTIKGPVLLTAVNGTSNCLSNGPQDPPAINAVTFNSFPFGAVDSINIRFTLLSAPANAGALNTPVRYYLIGGSGTTCGTAGCLQATHFISPGNPVSVVTGIPAASMGATTANTAFGSYSYAVRFYPKGLGAYVFRYEYSVNGGAVQTGTVAIKISRNFASNAGTDQDLACGVTATSLIGNNMFFNNTADPSNPITYAQGYNGEWSTVLKPVGAADPLNAGNKYLQSPSITGLADGKYTFRLAPNSNLETGGGCGSDDYVDVYVHTVAPAPQALLPVSVCNSGSVQLTMPETGYYPKGWAFVSGPSVPAFSPAVTSRMVTVGNLVAGNYQFSFTDSSKCGNAVSTINVSIGAATITRPVITCSFVFATGTLTLNATKPVYANGETGEFVRLVKGVEITPFSNGGNPSIYNTRNIASGGSTATDTIVTITGISSSTSVSSAIVVVYRISKPGCAVAADTILFSKDTDPASALNQTAELCNQTFPFVYTPVPTSAVPLTGNGPGNREWFAELNTQWSVVASPEGAADPVIGTQGSIHTGVTFFNPGTYILRATYPEAGSVTVCSGNANGVNIPAFSQFAIKIGDRSSAPAFAGADQVVCAPGAVNLAATPASGIWSLSSFNNAPAPAIANATNGNTAITFTAGGDAEFKWTPTATYAWCAMNDFDIVKVSYIGRPVIAGAAVTNLCNVPSDYVVNYNAPGSALVTAGFTQVSGPNTATITPAGAESSSLSNLVAGTYVFKYSFTSAGCGTADTTITLVIGACITVSGHLWIDNDGNATNNSEVNTNLAGAMWAYLTDADGNIIAKTAIDATGYYAFNGVVSGGAYKIVLAQNGSAQLGGKINSSSVPAVYGNTGVNINGAANTGNQTGVIDLGIVTGNRVNQDFGIQRLPESAFNAQFIGLNPGGTVNTPVDPSWFQVNNVGANPNTQDYDGGTVNNIRITAFPSNATSITINGTVYYPNAGSIPGGCGACAVFPGGGVIVPYTNGSGPSQVISVDPIDGLPSVVIPFVSIDNAGREDLTPGSVTLTYTSTLPVRLQSFTATPQNSSVVLQWTVSDELNMRHYIPEHSSNGVLFSAMGTVPATGRHNYVFNHNAPVYGINYYRLKSVDANGRLAYSEVRAVTFGKNSGFILVYPNPAKDYVNITLTGSMVNRAIAVTIVDMDGKLVLRKYIHKAGQAEAIDISKLAAGKYVVNIITGEETISKAIKVLR